ncbi:MAG: hypothetical protein WC455_09705 [Dehalococcoidia bacterium]|jgi:hypothetical protein
MPELGKTSLLASGLPLRDALAAVSKDVASKKAEDTNTDEENQAIAKILTGQRVYSGDQMVAKSTTMEFQSLFGKEFTAARRLAITNYKDVFDPDTKNIIPGSKLEIDGQAEMIYIMALSLRKINDVLVEVPAIPAAGSDPKAGIDFVAKLNDTAKVIADEWHPELKRNAFAVLGAFMSKIESLFKVKALDFFSEPRTDSTLEKNTAGEDQG